MTLQILQNCDHFREQIDGLRRVNNLCFGEDEFRFDLSIPIKNALSIGVSLDIELLRLLH